MFHENVKVLCLGVCNGAAYSLKSQQQWVIIIMSSDIIYPTSVIAIAHEPLVLQN